MKGEETLEERGQSKPSPQFNFDVPEERKDGVGWVVGAGDGFLEGSLQ